LVDVLQEMLVVAVLVVLSKIALPALPLQASTAALHPMVLATVMLVSTSIDVLTSMYQ